MSRGTWSVHCSRIVSRTRSDHSSMQIKRLSRRSESKAAKREDNHRFRNYSCASVSMIVCKRRSGLHWKMQYARRWFGPTTFSSLSSRARWNKSWLIFSFVWYDRTNATHLHLRPQKHSFSRGWRSLLTCRSYLCVVSFDYQWWRGSDGMEIHQQVREAFEDDEQQRGRVTRCHRWIQLDDTFQGLYRDRASTRSCRYHSKNRWCPWVTKQRERRALIPSMKCQKWHDEDYSLSSHWSIKIDEFKMTWLIYLSMTESETMRDERWMGRQWVRSISHSTRWISDVLLSLSSVAVSFESWVFGEDGRCFPLVACVIDPVSICRIE